MTLDEGLVEAIQEDYEHAPSTAADRAMLDYVGKLTKDATTIGPADHEGLRRHGFDASNFRGGLRALVAHARERRLGSPDVFE